MTQYFQSDDLSFVASAILDGSVTIKKVTFHPNKPGVKIFHLSPYVIANKIYLEYVSDKLKISPQLLSQKIASLRHLRAEVSK